MAILPLMLHMYIFISERRIAFLGVEGLRFRFRRYLVECPGCPIHLEVGRFLADFARCLYWFQRIVLGFCAELINEDSWDQIQNYTALSYMISGWSSEGLALDGLRGMSRFQVQSFRATVGFRA